MVLWEITLATAYFLGLRRTYRIALRAQRRLIGPNHPKLRSFVHGRVRGLFDVVVGVCQKMQQKNIELDKDVVVGVVQKIQQKNIELAKNLKNSFLPRLDRITPSVEIGSPRPTTASSTNTGPEHVSNWVHRLRSRKTFFMKIQQRNQKRLHFSPLHSSIGSFPTMNMIMHPMKSCEYGYWRVRGLFDVVVGVCQKMQQKHIELDKDVVVGVGQKIQQKNIELAKNHKNSFLPWLDRINPSLQIGGPPPTTASSTNTGPEHVSNWVHRLRSRKPFFEKIQQQNQERLHFSPLIASRRSFPTMSMMMHQMKSCEYGYW